jgi:hypothetical protein
MSQFIVVKNPCLVTETEPYAKKAIFFTEYITEIYHYSDIAENVIIRFFQGVDVSCDNTLEDIINQLKGQ